MKLCLLALVAPTTAMMQMPPGVSESTICDAGLCAKPDMPYERVSASQPGYQWNDAGGYCGSWATQRAVLSKGAWISQQQVRDHTSPCGGNDNEILSCNIVEAWTNLKLSFNAFDFENTPLPQEDAYLSWLKEQLVAGHALAWMILWSGQSYPIYDLTPPSGMYGHVEPVIGILSNHPLNDTKVYDDDVVMHYTDGGVNTVHRVMSTLAGEWGGPGEKVRASARPSRSLRSRLNSALHSPLPLRLTAAITTTASAILTVSVGPSQASLMKPTPCPRRSASTRGSQSLTPAAARWLRKSRVLSRRPSSLWTRRTMFTDGTR